MVGPVVKKSVWLCLLSLWCFTESDAQLLIGTGFEYGVPVIVGKQVFVQTDPVGLSGVVGYELKGSVVYPTFSYLIKSIRVPVYSAGQSGLQDFATDHNFALNLNYRMGDWDKYLALFAGIGIAQIKPEDNVDGYAGGNAVWLRDTGSATMYPLVQAGGRWLWRILPNSNFYFCLEADMKYIKAQNNNEYYLWRGKDYAKATIGGNIFFPSVMVQLLYVFERRRENY